MSVCVAKIHSKLYLLQLNALIPGYAAFKPQCKKLGSPKNSNRVLSDEEVLLHG